MVTGLDVKTFSVSSQSEDVYFLDDVGDRVASRCYVCEFPDSVQLGLCVASRGGKVGNTDVHKGIELLIRRLKMCDIEKVSVYASNFNKKTIYSDKSLIDIEVSEKLKASCREFIKDSSFIITAPCFSTVLVRFLRTGKWLADIITVEDKEQEEELGHERKIYSATYQARNAKQIEMAKVRDRYTCQFPDCSSPTFKTKHGEMFVEVHHLNPVAEGGDDDLNNLVCLCSQHHSQIHYASDDVRAAMREALIHTLKQQTSNYI